MVKLLSAIFGDFGNKLASHFIVFLVGFAGALLLLKSNCSGPGDPIKVDSFFDTTYEDIQIKFSRSWWNLKPDSKEVYYPVYRDTSQFDTSQFLASLDTPAMVKDYLRRKYYSREFGDSNFSAHLKMQVWRNEIDSLKFDYQLDYRERTVNKTVEKTLPGPRFIPMVTAGVDYLEPGFVYRKGQWYLGAGYEIDRQLKEGLRVKVGYSF